MSVLRSREAESESNLVVVVFVFRTKRRHALRHAKQLLLVYQIALQGYLAHEKLPPPRTLQQAHA